MTKLLTIGWKDLKLMFRDRAALILMLAAPFALTLGMGMITGAFRAAAAASASCPWSSSTRTAASWATRCRAVADLA